jgi:hypothetical protein
MGKHSLRAEGVRHNTTPCFRLNELQTSSPRRFFILTPDS